MHDKSRGIPMQNYSRIIVFNNEKTFEDILKVNPHLKPLIGVDQQSKKDYPNTYIAGVVKMSDKNNKKEGDSMGKSFGVNIPSDCRFIYVFEDEEDFTEQIQSEKMKSLFGDREWQKDVSPVFMAYMPITNQK